MRPLGGLKGRHDIELNVPALDSRGGLGLNPAGKAFIRQLDFIGYFCRAEGIGVAKQFSLNYR
jgi:hypothetical protein